MNPTANHTLQAAVLTLLALVAALAVTVTILLTQHHTTPAATTQTVTTTTDATNYNDGYATAQQDDCQQGDTTACQWLQANGFPAAN